MTKSIAPPLRAGVAIGDMRGFMHGMPPREVEEPEATPPLRRPYWKRLARRILAPLKGAIHPALFRMQTRMASAVDGSFAASVVLGLDRDVRGRLSKIESEMTDRLSLLRDEVHECRIESEQIRLKLEDNLAITTLQVSEGQSLGERLDGLLQRNVIPLKDAVALRTAAGYVLASADDDRAVVDLVEGAGRPAPWLQATIAGLLTEGGGLIEVGARDGRLAVAAARLVGPKGRVLAFAGDEASATLIARAAQLNATPWLQAPASDGASLALDAAAGAGANIDLVRIAAETDPAALLAGMRRILADNPDLAIAVRLDSPKGYAAWRAALEGEGFAAWIPDAGEAVMRPAPAGLAAGGADLLFTRGASTDSRLVRP